MTDIMESGLPVGDGTDQSPSSQQAGVQISSPGGVGLETVLAEIKRLSQEIRGVQSVTDKNKAELKKELSIQKELFTRMSAYLEKYKDPDEAYRQMAFDDLIAGRETQAPVSQVPVTQPQVSGGTPATLGIDPELLSLLGVDPSDPQFVAEMAGGATAIDAAKAVARSNKQASAPNPAAIQSTGAAAPTAPQKAALQDAFDKEMSQLRRGDWQTAEAIKAKYRRKGLSVY